MGVKTKQQHSRPFRADIQGLRAVAVLAVVLYHAHVGALSGGFVGVDVFFVISGFLITDMLWRELKEGGHISLRTFYARRARRLLPAAMLVLVVTMVAALILLPPLQIASVWKDGVATALYGSNYRFAFLQTSYLTSSLPPSPFQQYWSLGVEEQFYLLWPLLLLLFAGLSWWWPRRRGRATGQRTLHASTGAPAEARRPPSRLAGFVGLSVVAMASFAFSFWLTRADQPWAFFSLPSRAWELAAGGLVALAAPVLSRLPILGAVALGWAGVGAIIAAVLWFTPYTAFPGVAALAPVLGAAAVLAGGLVASAWGPVALLGLAPMRLVGDVSYSWYLWHWPVLVLVPVAVGHALSQTDYLVLAGWSGLLAGATYLVVEEPARKSSWLAQRPLRSLSTGFSLSALGVCSCVVASVMVPSIGGRGLAPVATLHITPSARVLPVPPKKHEAPALAEAQARLAADQRSLAQTVRRSVATVDVPANLVPPLADASADQPLPDEYGCTLGFLSTYVPPCVFGDVNAKKTVVIFGDSHAAQWFPALDKVADARHWRLIVWTKATCPPVDISLFSPDLGRPYTECSEFRSSAIARIKALRPMLVVMGIAPNYDSPYGVVQDGPAWLADLGKVVAQVRSSGAQVLVMGPVESPGTVVPDCLSGNLDDVVACNIAPIDHHEGPGLVGYDRAGVVAERDTIVKAGGHFVDVKPWFCTPQMCPVVIGNLLVFRDNDHITATYSAFLSPVVADEVDLYLPPVKPSTELDPKK